MQLSHNKGFLVAVGIVAILGLYVAYKRQTVTAATSTASGTGGGGTADTSSALQDALDQFGLNSTSMGQALAKLIGDGSQHTVDALNAQTSADAAGFGALAQGEVAAANAIQQALAGFQSGTYTGISNLENHLQTNLNASTQGLQNTLGSGFGSISSLIGGSETDIQNNVNAQSGLINNNLASGFSGVNALYVQLKAFIQTAFGSLSDMEHQALLATTANTQAIAGIQAQQYTSAGLASAASCFQADGSINSTCVASKFDGSTQTDPFGLAQLTNKLKAQYPGCAKTNSQGTLVGFDPACVGRKIVGG